MYTYIQVGHWRSLEIKAVLKITNLTTLMHNGFKPTIILLQLIDLRDRKIERLKKFILAATFFRSVGKKW